MSKTTVDTFADGSSVPPRDDSRPTIVVVGSYGAGLTLRCERVPDAGETVVGRSFSSGHGGKGSNQAIAAARLGARVSFCSVVGDDDFGSSALQLWILEGVDSRLVHVATGSTMVGVILVDATGENRIAIAPGVLDGFSPSLLNGLDEVLNSAQVLLVGLEIPVATAFEALAAGRRAGVTTVLNPAPVPTAPLPSGMLEMVDHLLPNRTEAAQLAGCPVDADPDELAGSACFQPVDTLVMTLGAAGCLVRTDDVVTLVPATPVADVVDTTGAGDSFAAAYAVGIAEGLDALEAARFAVRAAAHSVRTSEVVPSLPYRHEVAEVSPVGVIDRQDSS